MYMLRATTSRNLTLWTPIFVTLGASSLRLWTCLLSASADKEKSSISRWTKADDSDPKVQLEYSIL